MESYVAVGENQETLLDLPTILGCSLQMDTNGRANMAGHELTSSMWIGFENNPRGIVASQNQSVGPLFLVAFLLLVAMPGAPSSFLFLVVRPGAPGSVLAPVGPKWWELVPQVGAV